MDKVWNDLANKLIWSKKWEKTFEQPENAPTKWFVGGELNLCYNCVDRHIDEGYGDQECFVYDSPITNTRESYTYKELLDKISKLSDVLNSHGILKGDRVMVLSPNTVEVFVATLACVRVGAMTCVTTSHVPMEQLVNRINHLKPKAVLVVSHFYADEKWKDLKQKLDEALEISSHTPAHCFVFERLGMQEVKMVKGRDVNWNEAVKTAHTFEAVPMEATEPILAFYTSGSSGKPKAVVHSVGNFTMGMFCGPWTSFDSENAVFAAFNIGTLAGLMKILFRPMINRFKTVLYEGTPYIEMKAEQFYKLLDENKVSHLIFGGTVIKHLKKLDPESDITSLFNFENLRIILITGERPDLGSYQWAIKTFKSSIWNIFGQTEMCVLAGCDDYSASAPLKATDAAKPRLGCDIVILKDDGTEAKPNELGRVLFRLPVPPGTMLTLLDDHELCREIYFSTYPGYYDTKDDGYLDDKGHLKIEYRADSRMKQGDIHLSPESVEEVALTHPMVAECCVVGYPDIAKRELPVTLFLVANGCGKDVTRISEEIEQLYSEKFGSSVCFAKAINVKELPVTVSTKIHRKSVNNLVKGLSIESFLSSIVNPHVFRSLSKDLRDAGYDGSEISRHAA